jgi:hypothetical protein
MLVRFDDWLTRARASSAQVATWTVIAAWCRAVGLEKIQARLAVTIAGAIAAFVPESDPEAGTSTNLADHDDEVVCGLSKNIARMPGTRNMPPSQADAMPEPPHTGQDSLSSDASFTRSRSR